MSGNRCFGARSTTDEVLQGINLRGRVAVVTGASGGLGEETARALAAAGAHVVVAARNEQKASVALERIRVATGSEALEFERLDLASLASVRACAARLLRRHLAIHLLINNAGIMACPLERTVEGFEMQLASNHLGHFLLAGLLLPSLLRAAPSRVVALSSIGHRVCGVQLDDLNFERRAYNAWIAYGQSKTANVLFAVEFDRRFGPDGVHAYAVHPGAIPTELNRHLDAAELAAVDAHSPGGKLQRKTVAEGAATTVYAATAPELAGRGGCYLEDCHVAAINDARGSAEGVKSYALDGAMALGLWTASEAMVGERFGAA
ncbi:MAG: SDR family NAD(P)-dependent oxidoreductase [Pseudomonadales bacterium]|jgi:NAD(P)-dependent dehydrogenase (short-subunit alcohol dehydrogenase family)|nr:SDR family NAD(P)-dependent oxidoreductase [Pseudomonadales bacterium]MCP5337416.1 SDR family NAD(P)-dependent oxidoreductase [Pseudomonadales bacterium]